MHVVEFGALGSVVECGVCLCCLFWEGGGILPVTRLLVEMEDCWNKGGDAGIGLDRVGEERVLRLLTAVETNGYEVSEKTSTR
jgi:hypothetical protein